MSKSYKGKATTSAEVGIATRTSRSGGSQGGKQPVRYNDKQSHSGRAITSAGISGGVSRSKPAGKC